MVGNDPISPGLDFLYPQGQDPELRSSFALQDGVLGNLKRLTEATEYTIILVKKWFSDNGTCIRQTVYRSSDILSIYPTSFPNPILVTIRQKRVSYLIY